MGCGASSAAGDRAIVAATKIDPAVDNLPAVKEPKADVKRPSDSTNNSGKETDAKEDGAPKEESSKPRNLPEHVSSTIPKSAVPDAPPAQLGVQSEKEGLGKVDDAQKAAPVKEEPKSPEIRDGKDGLPSPGSAPSGAQDQEASEGVSTPTGDPLLANRQSQNKLPPLKSSMAAVDLSKDPFAKPVLPTSVPLHSAAPVASSPTGTPTAAVDSLGPKTPSSLASTPKPADSPAPGTPVSARAAESNSLGPSKLGPGSDSGSGVDVLRASAETEFAHTPRTATETALTALMDDVSAVHVE